MTELMNLRQRFREASAARESALAVRGQFAKANWRSQTAWERLGYSVREGDTSGIVLDFPTPRGVKSYTAYHAGQVELRPAVWRKMVSRCAGLPDLDARVPAHRAEVFVALVAAGEEALATRLLPSLAGHRQFEEHRACLSRLDEEVGRANEAFAAAKRAYEEVWLPIVQRRQATRRRRDLLGELALLGMTMQSVPTEASVAELEECLRRKRAEVQRQSDLAELNWLGVDVSTLPSDLPLNALRRLVERRRRQTEPLRVSRVLRMSGIDPDGLPDGADPRQVLDLVEMSGYLATVPAGVSPEDRLADLRSRGKALAAWACEHYPTHVRDEPCFHTPGRVKLMFKRPSRAAHPRPTRRRRPRCHPDSTGSGARLRWQVVGF